MKCMRVCTVQRRFIKVSFDKILPFQHLAVVAFSQILDFLIPYIVHRCTSPAAERQGRGDCFDFDLVFYLCTKCTQKMFLGAIFTKFKWDIFEISKFSSHRRINVYFLL